MESMQSTYVAPNAHEESEIFVAGQCVSAGTYRERETQREVLIEQPGYLPASLDGRVACYERVLSWDRSVVRRPEMPQKGQE